MKKKDEERWWVIVIFSAISFFVLLVWPPFRTFSAQLKKMRGGQRQLEKKEEKAKYLAKEIGGKSDLTKPKKKRRTRKRRGRETSAHIQFLTFYNGKKRKEKRLTVRRFFFVCVCVCVFVVFFFVCDARRASGFALDCSLPASHAILAHPKKKNPSFVA